MHLCNNNCIFLLARFRSEKWKILYIEIVWFAKEFSYTKHNFGIVDSFLFAIFPGRFIYEILNDSVHAMLPNWMLFFLSFLYFFVVVFGDRHHMPCVLRPPSPNIYIRFFRRVCVLFRSLSPKQIIFYEQKTMLRCCYFFTAFIFLVFCFICLFVIVFYPPLSSLALLPSTYNNWFFHVRRTYTQCSLTLSFSLSLLSYLILTLFGLTLLQLDLFR